ncbi:hypothetical protein M6B38_257500 [Iris pallida]|uniref:Uncharacterized protein n=1 Tax=Iris pallida TaxID=29817 RepID=A0AAX6IFV4_IRIPA|nr:hypothetical protein M6B38_390220 [Iris pallida]KAJ6852136.1 hypothetical protein M6B38_257500 [Iris pallida]
MSRHCGGVRLWPGKVGTWGTQYRPDLQLLHGSKRRCSATALGRPNRPDLGRSSDDSVAPAVVRRWLCNREPLDHVRSRWWIEPLAFCDDG